MGGGAEFLHSAKRERKDGIHDSLARETAACGKRKKGVTRSHPRQRHREAPIEKVRRATPKDGRRPCGLVSQTKIRGFLARPQPEATQIVMLRSMSYWEPDRSSGF